MATDYTNLEAVRADLGFPASNHNDDEIINLAITAASRQVDDWCGRRFWPDLTVVVREFFGDGSNTLDLLEQPSTPVASEISSTSGLIVKIDDDGDGTFETTLTNNTDFLLQPRNAAADVRAWDSLLRIDAAWPCFKNGRAGVQITALFGWPDIPPEVERAARLQAALLFKSKDAALGAMSLGEVGTVFAKAKLHPTAQALIGHLQRAPIG